MKEVLEKIKKEAKEAPPVETDQTEVDESKSIPTESKPAKVEESKSIPTESKPADVEKPDVEAANAAPKSE